MENRLSGSDAPELTPEEKINMSLDEIIKRGRIKGAISHSLLRNKRPQQYIKRPQTRPFHRRRTSQQWRLGRNGPNTPRPRRNPFFRVRGYQRNAQNIAAFLERKLQMVGPHSVFHRLGWNPTKYAAQRFLNRARYFHRRPQFRPFRFHHLSHDPHRFQKIIAAQKFYQQQNGLSSSIFPYCAKEDVRTLNEVNLKRLSEALGGTITSVKEDISPEGSVVTTITRKSVGPRLIPPPVQFIEYLDPAIQQHIAMMQDKPYEGHKNSSFLPKCFVPDQNKGFDCRYTPCTTAISTSVRFASLANTENMEID